LESVNNETNIQDLTSSMDAACRSWARTTNKTLLEAGWRVLKMFNNKLTGRLHAGAG